MRASNVIIQRTQLPLTLIGLPPPVAISLPFLAMTCIVLGLTLSWPITGFLMAFIVPVVVGIYVGAVNLRDPHFFTAGPQVSRFWGSRKTRVFLAGEPTQHTPVEIQRRRKAERASKMGAGS